MQSFNSQKIGGNMRQDPPTPNFPQTNNVVLAIKLDTKKKTERAIICELDELTTMIHYREPKDRFIYEGTRPITSLLTETTTKYINLFVDLRVWILKEPAKPKEIINNTVTIIKALETLYSNDNCVYKYIALKIWEFYRARLKSGLDFESPRTTWDRIEDLTYPFRTSITNSLFETQKYSYNYKVPYSPFGGIFDDYRYPVQMLYNPICTGKKKKFYDIEKYVLTDFSILPLIWYYKKVIYEEKKYLRYCKVCGKLFLASDVSKTTMCSEECRKKQIHENRINYNEKHKNDPTEKTYNNEKAFWRYRINKAKSLIADEYIIADLSSAYKKFKDSALEMKHQVQDGKIEFAVFNEWILKQRNTIDNLMDKYNL